MTTVEDMEKLKIREAITNSDAEVYTDLWLKIKKLTENMGLSAKFENAVLNLIVTERLRCLNIVKSHHRFYTKNIDEIAKEISNGDKIG